MRPIRLATALSIISLLAGCSKSGPKAPSFTPGFNIYIVGNADGGAVYWKNGVKTILAHNASAQAIAVSGTDVYVGGYIADSADIQAAYWKNGQEFVLEGPGYSHVFGIAVNGSDVYCVGDILGPLGSGRDSATYWKNGVRMHLSPATNGKATSILFAGTETYISGEVWGPSDSGVVWKNGVQTWYCIPGTINSLALSQTDTFVVGTIGTQAAYWTHDKYHPLSPQGYGASIALSGSDVFIGGGITLAGGYIQAAYWKNDSINILKNSYKGSSVLGLAFAGTDLYAVGVGNGIGTSQALYWKNGVVDTLAGSIGTAYAISVGP